MRERARDVYLIFLKDFMPTSRQFIEYRSTMFTENLNQSSSGNIDLLLFFLRRRRKARIAYHQVFIIW